MANIQIVYLKRYCEQMWDKFTGQCYSDAAEDLGCPRFCCREKYDDEEGITHIPKYSCIYATYKKAFKGMTVKNYELEENCDDIEDEFFDTMTLSTKNYEYDCIKVTIDGECIYDNSDWMQPYEIYQHGETPKI